MINSTKQAYHVEAGGLNRILHLIVMALHIPKALVIPFARLTVLSTMHASLIIFAVPILIGLTKGEPPVGCAETFLLPQVRHLIGRLSVDAF